MAASRARPVSAEEPPQRRRQWTCKNCRLRLQRRTTRETEAEFRQRCARHQNSGRACYARLLIKQLTANGFVPLRSPGQNDFLSEYLALNDAGLVEWHFTHIIGDSYVRRSPWGPAWAAQYDYHLRRHKKRSLKQRADELRELAATPEGSESAMAFLALAQFDVDLGGEA